MSGAIWMNDQGSGEVRRLYYFTSERFGLEAIRDQRLKVSRFDEANDPFEFIGIKLARRERRKLALVKSKIGQIHGMICLSSNWHHPLMWAHYADNHKGLALGFDVPDEARFEKVTYRSDRPSLAELGISKFVELRGEEPMQQILSMKFEAWCYEDEWRIFVRLGRADPVTEFHFVDFAPALRLAQVLVGDRSTLTRSYLGRVLGDDHANVECFKVRPANKKFEFVEDKLQSAWKA